MVSRGPRGESWADPGTLPTHPFGAGSHPERTRRNVIDSDGTAILSHVRLGRGTLLTLSLSKRKARPHGAVDGGKTSEAEAAAEIAR